MSAKFEVVNRFAGEENLLLPKRGTSGAAGYDFVVAEDIVVPSFLGVIKDLEYEKSSKTLAETNSFTKAHKIRPVLVSTGVKCSLEDGCYLELSARSSTPLKHLLFVANSVGIIDSDYYNNPDNEGEIFFQIINLAPFDISLKKGDKIGQGIIKNYLKTDDDTATATRLGGFGSTGP